MFSTTANAFDAAFWFRHRAWYGLCGKQNAASKAFAVVENTRAPGVCIRRLLRTSGGGASVRHAYMRPQCQWRRCVIASTIAAAVGGWCRRGWFSIQCKCYIIKHPRLATPPARAPWTAAAASRPEHYTKRRAIGDTKWPLTICTFDMVFSV